MAAPDKAPGSWYSGLSKYFPNLQRKAILESRNPQNGIEDCKPVSDATDREMAYMDEINALKKRLSSAEDGETQAKLDLADMEEAFTKSRKMVINLHGEANSALESLDRYKEAYRNQEIQASTLETENNTLKHSLVEHFNTVENLKLQNRDLLASCQQKDAAFKDQLAANGREEWLKEKNILEHSLAEHVSTAENLWHQNQIIIESSQQEKTALKNQLAEQGREYELLKEKVCAAQQLSSLKIESPYWMPQARKDTSRALSQIQKNLKKWCEEWVNSEIFEVALANTESRSRLLDAVKHFVRLDENGLAPSSLSSADVRSKVPTMLFSGLVSQLVFKNIFDQPFLRGVNRREKALSEVLSVLKSRDEVSAENWRTQTFRLLHPTANDTSKKTGTSEHIADIAGHLAESTIKIASGLFMRDYFTETPCRELIKIITPAAELACQLWCQRTSMQVADLARLPEVLPDSDGPFSACTEFLEEHFLNRRELGRDKHALDQKAITVVVSPAILAYGDHDGTEFSNDTRHVLKKAVVWMG